MHKLQHYLQKKLPSPPSGSSVMTHTSNAPAEAMVMDEDEELERAMLSISPTKQHEQSCQLVTRPSRVPSIPPPQLPGYDHDGSVLTSRGSG
ncbi:hypothetical protein PFLUV_G00051230 [Perca fluviatilis]|uniref:Uncharacterized protein n=1 Tax=Perca fluviatilis TaxID=8168 RepID=A0A6A5ES50_PERFL|nr:hypothetical protein PFLUV_G00051200 [Perca fluviatilis]KAF1392287.1 hypothetical protein PFLUV_G00051230 [Perca fluviatilis]